MVTLIIGGRDAGKYEYLLHLGHQPQDMGTNFDKAVLYKLNDLVKGLLKSGIEPVAFIKSKLEGLSDMIIVCDEVGCGVVPADPFEREYREAVGRACCEIAKKADIVERIYSGISTRIKG